MSQLVTVPFRGDTLFAIEDRGTHHVATTPICNALGVNPDRQRDRIKRDTILSEGATMMVVPSAGGSQETFVLRLDLVNAWLLGIDDKRISDPEVRARVLTYKRECAAALFRHFFGSPAEPEPSAPPPIAARQEPTRIRKQLVTEARAIWGERVAGRLWWALDLPIVEGMATEPVQSSFGFTYTALPTQPRPPGPGGA